LEAWLEMKKLKIITRFSLKNFQPKKKRRGKICPSDRRELKHF